MLEGNCAIHVRPLGNSPKFRVYVEAGTATAARDLLAQAMNEVKNADRLTQFKRAFSGSEDCFSATFIFNTRANRNVPRELKGVGSDDQSAPDP